ncbi:MAG: phage replisome organizer N-terminal domain-containing protein, partial [Acutalibacteraceae bacterium]
MNVSWIKFATNFFHNPKIMLLKNRKNGAEMVLFFVHLLTLAGEENNGGVFTMPDGSPCDAEYFSVVTGTSKAFAEACLQEFERLKMITYDGN